MAGDKYIALIGGKNKEVVSIQASSGVGSANKIASVDSTGKFDISLMPLGVSAEVVVAVTSENLIAGDFVNIYSNAGVATLRKANATDNTKPAHGFVIAGTTSPASATMYILGVTNSFVSGLTVGTVYYLNTTSGTITSTPLSATGNINQMLGIAISTTGIMTHNSVSSIVEIA